MSLLGVVRPAVGFEQRWNRLSEALRLQELQRRPDGQASGGPEIPHMPSWACRRGAARMWLVAQLTSAVLEISQAGFTGARHPQAVPSAIHRGEAWQRPDPSAKILTGTMERRLFPDTRVTAFRLAA